MGTVPSPYIFEELFVLKKTIEWVNRGNLLKDKHIDELRRIKNNFSTNH